MALGIKDTLPAHIRGEFETLNRRKEMLEKKIAALAKVNETEVDISGYEKRDRSYLLERWFKKHSDKFIDDRGRTGYIACYAWQSCWPEESSGMLHQYLHDMLGVRFKWWAKFVFRERDTPEIKRVADSCVENGALPNMNACHYACIGDYGEKFYDAKSVIQACNEMYNYTSSPNLRENRVVTGIYTAKAVAVQYLPVQARRAEREETTTIADLWFEACSKGLVVESMCKSICNKCDIGRENISCDIMNANGKYLLYLPFAYKITGKNIELMEQLLKVADTRELKRAKLCEVCCFDSTRKLEERMAFATFAKAHVQEER